MLVAFFLGWIFFSFVVAAMAEGRKFGFWWTLAASLVLSPLIGFLFMITSDKEDPEKKQRQSSQNRIDNALIRKDYTALKQVYIDIVGRKPNNSPNECYNLAVLYAGEKDNDAALFYLRKSLISGFHDLEVIRNTSAFCDLREMDNYKKMMHEFIA